MAGDKKRESLVQKQTRESEKVEKFLKNAVLNELETYDYSERKLSLDSFRVYEEGDLTFKNIDDEINYETKLLKIIDYSLTARC